MVTIRAIPRVWHVCGDLLFAAFLTVMGVIGFLHDDKNYLQNGLWDQYDDGDWLSMEIGGLILLIVAV